MKKTVRPGTRRAPGTRFLHPLNLNGHHNIFAFVWCYYPQRLFSTELPDVQPVFREHNRHRRALLKNL